MILFPPAEIVEVESLLGLELRLVSGASSFVSDGSDLNRLRRDGGELLSWLQVVSWVYSFRVGIPFGQGRNGSSFSFSLGAGS